MKNYMMNQMLSWYILVFIPIKEDVQQHLVYLQIDQVYAKYAKNIMTKIMV